MADIGISMLAADLLQMASQINGDCEEVTEKHTKAAADHMRANVAVDTGETRDSISHEVTVSKGVVIGEAGATTPQARYLEDGTANMGPRPFAGPALESETEDYVESIGDAAVKQW